MGVATSDEMPQSYDPFDDRAVFEYKYSIIPRRCHTTNQWIWGLSMRGRWRRHADPGDPVVEDRWYHRDEAIIKMLKG